MAKDSDKQISLEELHARAVLYSLGWFYLGLPERVGVELEFRHGKSHTGWVLRAYLGPMNVWGLRTDGVWQYKGWDYFPTREAALAAFNASLAVPRWDGFDFVGKAGEDEGRP